MNNSDEMIEETLDVNENNGAGSNSVNKNNEVLAANGKVEKKGNALDAIADASDDLESSSDSSPEEIEIYPESKGKIPLLIVLSVFLILDILALIVYIIGLDKVLSFIK